MIGKATAEAPANIAFVKYWGTRDVERTLPCNPSISMTLSHCVTRTTVAVEASPGPDEAFIVADGRLQPGSASFAEPVFAHLARIRAWLSSEMQPHAVAEGRFVLATVNSFPSDAGLASSASGFAALTVAAARAAGLTMTPRELSSLARLSGSGSAARSLFGGYVEWPAGSGEAEAGAASLAPREHWELRDVIAVVQRQPKPVSSREGHRRAPTSPHFAPRQERLPDRLAHVRRAIAERSLARLGPVLEDEAIELHLIAMTSRPPILYWEPATVAVLRAAHRLRDGGVEVYFTIDAGANVHLICEPAAEGAVCAALAEIREVAAVLRDGVGPGPRLLEEHLF